MARSWGGAGGGLERAERRSNEADGGDFEVGVSFGVTEIEF